MALIEPTRNERVDALMDAIRWSWTVPWQVERLHEAERAWVESQRRWQGPNPTDPRAVFGQQDRYPHHRFEAERHFVLIAAHQLELALKKLGKAEHAGPALRKNLAGNVRLLRDCSEHADTPDQGAHLRFREAHPTHSPTDHLWGSWGSRIGGLVLADELAAAAHEIHLELLRLEGTW